MHDISQSRDTNAIISAPSLTRVQRGAIESGRRIQARRIERRPHFEPAFQQKCGVLLRCIAPVRAPPSGQSVCGRRDAPSPFISERGREAEGSHKAGLA